LSYVQIVYTLNKPR